MIEWLQENFPHGNNYLIAQKDAEQINTCLSKQLVLPAYAGRKQGLWGETARRLSITGKKLGWVPNKLPAAFFADSVELEIADACAAKEGLLQSKKIHLDYAREILDRLNLLYLIQRNPYFLSEGETKLLWFITQWVKQPEYLVIGHLPSSLSKKRTDELLNFLLESKTGTDNTVTILLGYISHQKDWFSRLLTNTKWKIIQQLPCL